MNDKCYYCGGEINSGVACKKPGCQAKNTADMMEAENEYLSNFEEVEATCNICGKTFTATSKYIRFCADCRYEIGDDGHLVDLLGQYSHAIPNWTLKGMHVQGEAPS